MHEALNVPVKNQNTEIVGNATLYYTGRIDVVTDDEGKQLFDLLREGLADSLTIKANLVPAQPLVAESDIFDGHQLTMPIPRVGFMGVEVSKSGLKDAWESIVVPIQDSGAPLSMEWQIIMAALRSVYGAMPEDN